MTKGNVIKFIDLFCGIVSFHYSFKKFGFKCVMASNIYGPAKIHIKNNTASEHLVTFVILNLMILNHMIFFAQDFHVNHFRAGHGKGFDDERTAQCFHK